jgi:putative transposase
VPFYQKRLRLPEDHYRGRRIFFITLCTENRQPYFAAQATGRWVLTHLSECAARQSFTLHAYCAMPDHLHFLAEGLSDTSDLVAFVNVYKQWTAYEFQKKHGSRLWQMRYYDHVLRPSEAIEDVASYIWWNPVRKGLCALPYSYPLSGSQTIEWIKGSSVARGWSPPWRL